MSNSRKIVRMENVRRVVQVLAFAAFVVLFALTIGKYDPQAAGTVLKSRAPVDTFFRIDPLLGLTTMISTRQIITVMLVYGLPVVILTVLAGRFFCGWICPLGTTLDASDAVFFRNREKGRRPRRSLRHAQDGSAEEKDRSRGPWRLRYYILAAVLIAAVFSAQLAYFLDPITIITRAFTFVIYPTLQMGARELVAAGVESDFLTRNAYLPRDVEYFFRLNFLAAAMLVGIIALNSISRRFWCRYLCPLGALLGVLSRFSIIRRIVKSDCIKCAKCVPDCKMGAIMTNPTQYRAPECIYCYSCTPVCPTLSTKIAPSVAKEGFHGELDLNRRRTVQALGIGALLATLGATNVAAKSSRVGKLKLSSDTLIRPPGALPEEEFIDRCVRCSECMKVCPTNGLQPALTEAGFAGLWTPVLVPRVGECSQNCNLCSQVCSTQAIQPVEISEKPHIFIGRAVIDRSACIAWNSDKQCMVCDECCSYHAVYWQTMDGVRRPFVDEHKCVGCGICENVCPIQPVAAIRVFSFGDQRHKSREEQKAFFQQSKRK